MLTYFWIAVGSALGGMARYGCSGLVARSIGEIFPWGTLVVNVVGSFVIGMFARFAETGSGLGEPTVRQFVMIGLCGGYTTFSSFSLQTMALARGGEWGRVVANILLSVILCLVSVVLGQLAGDAVENLGGG
jgi:fluoride exporter